MSRDVQKICPLCAWRESCAKRFAMGGDVTLHCPDFTEDVQLQRKSAINEADSAKTQERE